jgi:hypothetical protein
LERSVDIEAWPSKRELSRRRSAGIEVVLYWCDATEAVTLFVLDERTGEAFEVEVAGAQALDAFNHPYAYSGGVRAA